MKKDTTEEVNNDYIVAIPTKEENEGQGNDKTVAVSDDNTDQDNSTLSNVFKASKELADAAEKFGNGLKPIADGFKAVVEWKKSENEKVVSKNNLEQEKTKGRYQLRLQEKRMKEAEKDRAHESLKQDKELSRRDKDRASTEKMHNKDLLHAKEKSDQNHERGLEELAQRRISIVQNGDDNKLKHKREMKKINGGEEKARVDGKREDRRLDEEIEDKKFSREMRREEMELKRAEMKMRQEEMKAKLEMKKMELEIKKMELRSGSSQQKQPDNRQGNVRLFDSQSSNPSF